MSEINNNAIVEDALESNVAPELVKGSDGFYSILVDTKNEIEGRDYLTVLGIKLAEIPQSFVKGIGVDLRYSLNAVSDNKITVPKVGFINQLRCVSVIVENDETIFSYVADNSLSCMQLGLNHVEHIQQHVSTDNGVISKTLPGDLFYISIDFEGDNVEVPDDQPKSSEPA